MEHCLRITLIGLALGITACTPRSQDAMKEVPFNAEIPATWSYVSRGDIGEAPLPVDGTLQSQYISYSIAEYGVLYGGANGNQADIYEMRPNDVKELISVRKNTMHTSTWQEEIVRGTSTVVEVLPLEGNEGEGWSPAKLYYLLWTDARDAANPGRGMIIHKQAGDARFEEGFRHFLDTLAL